MKNRIFFKDGYFCDIEKDPSESLENYIKRGNFVVSQKPKNSQELEYAKKISRVWINFKTSNCQYSDQINKIMCDMEKNLFN